MSRVYKAGSCRRSGNGLIDQNGQNSQTINFWKTWLCLGLHALLLYLQVGEHASVVSYVHIHIQTDNYSKVVVQEQGHTNTSKSMSNGGNLRGRSSLTSVTSTVTSRCHHRFLLCMWKHRLDACTVWHVPVSKHVDTACVYRYRPSLMFGACLLGLTTYHKSLPALILCVLLHA